MARTATARRPTPVAIEEPQDLTFGGMKAAAEIYWPGLGGKVADQWRCWNKELFDNRLRPAPMVLSRMSRVHGHWFCTLDPCGDQRMGFEQQLVTQIRSYTPPRTIASVRRVDLLRQMLRQLYAQDGKAAPEHNSQEWCELIMKLHLRLAGQRIWASPQYTETTPQQDLGKGLFRPAETRSYQDNDPETGAESLPLAQIKVWPHGLIELGNITRD
jgi:hypothetical protein